MGVLSYISVNSAATPISQDPPNTPVPNPRQTKVILPNKKPLKWSTGMAPGDYGGPPTTTKLRKYWGGEEEDPLSSDDFMWNKDFMGRFQRLVKNNESSIEATPIKVFFFFPLSLSLARCINLFSLILAIWVSFNLCSYACFFIEFCVSFVNLFLEYGI
jgi:hypothetical protein